MTDAAVRGSPPNSESELLERCRKIAGLALAELASSLSVTVPEDLHHHKGWVGHLLESALGAEAGSRAAPDFERLGIELKTLPVDEAGRPLESTFVCTIPLVEIGDVEWQQSRVWRKLAKVLWVPVLGSRSVKLAERRVGSAFLWSPSEEDEQMLKFDWEELAGLIGRGDVERLTGHLGRYLQVRPKAARGSSRRLGRDAEGRLFQVLPRGFYLRATFTARILRAQFGLV